MKIVTPVQPFNLTPINLTPKVVRPETVIVVGSGVVGLTTALYLRQAGFEVSCIDAGPDPTLPNADLARAGTTFRGGNARHISATETCPHATASRSGIIYKLTSKGGWLAKQPSRLTPAEQQWMAAFEHLTTQPHVIAEYTDDVVVINTQGKRLWKQLIREFPHLFLNTGLQRRVAIFFLDQQTFDSEAAFEDRYNPTVKRLYPRDIGKRYPALAHACGEGLIAGGIEEDCLAINAVDFCVKVVHHLRAAGVEFRWGERVSEIAMSETGDVAYLTTEDQGYFRASHYVLSPGYYSSHLFCKMKCANKIMGVAGVWIHIANPGFKGAFKIDAPEPTGYINATLRGQQLVISGGYGFIGNDALDSHSPGIQALFHEIEDVIRRLLPESYDKALKEETLDRKACVRPMTASGLGVFEVLGTLTGGKAIIVGGNSAGGFTQAPALAQAVVNALEGRANNFVCRAFDPTRV